jgi:WD40 repeat protein
MKLWKLPDWSTSTANPVMLTPQTGTMIMISPTKKCIKTYKGHEREITLLKEMTIQHTKQIFTASNDSTVKIWSLLKERCKQTLEGHGDKINAMEMIANSMSESPFQMITASDDGSISVWKFQIHSASS